MREIVISHGVLQIEKYNEHKIKVGTYNVWCPLTANSPNTPCNIYCAFYNELKAQDNYRKDMACCNLAKADLGRIVKRTE